MARHSIALIGDEEQRGEEEPGPEQQWRGEDAHREAMEKRSQELQWKSKAEPRAAMEKLGME